MKPIIYHFKIILLAMIASKYIVIIYLTGNQVLICKYLC